MVEKWWIRMPQLGYRERQVLPNGLRGSEWIVIGILEQGGWVDEVQTLAGSTIWNAPTARLEGVVVDEASATTVGAATVHLLGTDWAVTTDGRGAFAVDSLAPGRYRLAVGHPAIDVARHVQPPFIATLGRGDTVRVEVRLRAVESIIGALCPELPADSGVVAGLVRIRETGASVSGAAVAARWSRWYRSGGVLREERFGAESETDESGYYYLCGMPLDATLTLQMSASGTAPVSDSLVIGAERVHRRDFELPDPSAASALTPGCAGPPVRQVVLCILRGGKGIQIANFLFGVLEHLRILGRRLGPRRPKAARLSHEPQEHDEQEEEHDREGDGRHPGEPQRSEEPSSSRMSLDRTRMRMAACGTTR
ncbi:MAG: carboxypeptidase-like regulatory domain-containing protein [Gemmatimonadota bacterium]|nr:carboxypeptidase-like regulatory domain-containing protein [Gemmatimonadota bacterium]MDH3477702.1 carboxypeptidase-like regulatory domain-containing protein [Gemmatimonadota bacterium]MDH3571574.1 carboxypeptidase-like regulatory domain-containing protein [Gemmatimonadota bacterium]MDH5549293.1 carboxypeptidase-like regulatory domain-containing protein [Gemmatimonadota bacterium]